MDRTQARLSVLVMTRKMPEIIEVSSPQLEELLVRAASNTLLEEDTQLIGQIFDSYVHFFEIVGDKNTTLARLRKLLFGASTEKADKLFGEQQKPEVSPGPGADNAEPEPAGSEAQPGEATSDTPAPGHGRYGGDDYPGAQQVDVPHPTLRAGDACPLCHKGTLYEKKPCVFVRFVGQAPLHDAAQIL
jgi:transposase